MDGLIKALDAKNKARRRRRSEQVNERPEVSNCVSSDVTDVASAFAVDGERWAPVGSLTMDSVATVLAASAEAPLPASGVIDLARVELVDFGVRGAVAGLEATRERRGQATRFLTPAGQPGVARAALRRRDFLPRNQPDPRVDPPPDPAPEPYRHASMSAAVEIIGVRDASAQSRRSRASISPSMKANSSACSAPMERARRR